MTTDERLKKIKEAMEKLEEAQRLLDDVDYDIYEKNCEESDKKYFGLMQRAYNDVAEAIKTTTIKFTRYNRKVRTIEE